MAKNASGASWCNSCWQAGPAELEAEDLDEALADAWVLRKWGEAAVDKLTSMSSHVTTHSEASEEKQRRKKRSKDRKNQVPK